MIPLEKFETILTESIREITTGQSSLQDCLERHPSQRAALEPLLKLAGDIRPPQPITLDRQDKTLIRARLMQQIGAEKQSSRPTWSDALGFGLPARLSWVRIPMMILIGLLLISTVTGGTVYASQSSLPGDWLYGVKTGAEEARLRLTRDESTRIDLEYRFARQRLDEIERLNSRDAKLVGQAVEGYRRNLEKARIETTAISEPAALQMVLEKSAALLAGQIDYCDRLLDAAPQNGELVAEAALLAVDQQIEVLRRHSENEIVPAARANREAMQQRLQRAIQKADGQQYSLMNRALMQYRHYTDLDASLLEVVQTTGQGASELAELNAQTLPECLADLEALSLQAPPEYQDIIETCRRVTTDPEGQFRYWYRQRSGQDQEPVEPPGREPAGSPSGVDEPGQANGQGNSGPSGSEKPQTTPAPPAETGAGDGSGSGSGSGGGSGSEGAGWPPGWRPRPAWPGAAGPGPGPGRRSGWVFAPRTPWRWRRS